MRLNWNLLQGENTIQNYYAIRAELFYNYSNIEFNFVDTFEYLCQKVARELVDLIKSNASRGQMIKAISPRGLSAYRPFEELNKQEGVSCKSLVEGVINLDVI